MNKTRGFWPILFLAICAVLPLWRAIFQGQVIGPFDQIRHMAPWNGPTPERPWDVLQADAVLQFYPWRDMVFESWGKGQLPAWNPYELAGTPLLANSQSGALYPPHILLGVLHVPTTKGITLLAWFHLFWAGLGVYYLTRRLGALRIGAALAGAAFALSPFMLAWTGLASVTTTVAWIPWILGLMVALAIEGGFSKARSFKLSLGLTCCVAMMFLGGHLQFCAYGCLAAGLMLVWLLLSEPIGSVSGAGGFAGAGSRGGMLGRAQEAVRKAQELDIELKRDLAEDRKTQGPKRRFRYGLIVGSLLLGGFLAAPQLLPVLNFGKFSHRANTPTSAGYSAYVNGSVPGLALQGLAFPTALGNPAQPSPAIKDVNSYWPQLTNLGMDFAESALGFGPLVFLLLFCTPKPKRGSAALVFVGVLALLAALGTFVDWPLYYWVPGWSATGSPGRAGVLVVLAACVLAGLACENVQELDKKSLSALVAGGTIIGLLLAFFVYYRSYPSQLGPADQINAAIRATVSGQGSVILATLIVSLLAVGAYKYKAGYGWALPVGAAAVAFIAYGMNLIPTSDSTLPPIQADASQRYAFVNDNLGLWSPAPAVMPPNTASCGRLHDIAGYDSLLHRDSVNMLRAIDGADPASVSNGNMMFVKPKAKPDLLSEAGVTRVWSLRPLTGFGAEKQVGNVYEYDLPGSGRFQAPGPVTVESESYDSLRVQAAGPGPLIDRDRMMPGWSATIDGKPGDLKAADSPLGKGLWREVDLPSGTHVVEFRYSPPGFKTGIWLALLSIPWIAWLIFGSLTAGKSRANG